MTEYEARLFLSLLIAICLAYILRAYRVMYSTTEVMSKVMAATYMENFDLKTELATRKAAEQQNGVHSPE